MKQSYPVWRYHPEKGALLLRSKEAHDALGDGWFDTPAKFPKIEEKPAQAEAPRGRRAKASHGGGKA